MSGVFVYSVGTLDPEHEQRHDGWHRQQQALGREKGTSTRLSRLRQASTARKAKARAGNAAAVEVRLSRRRLKRMTKQVSRLENEVHQAMAVLDAYTGKLLSYRQLLRHPKHKKGWQISSANEFGHLANGSGAGSKARTQSNSFRKTKFRKII